MDIEQLKLEMALAGCEERRISALEEIYERFREFKEEVDAALAVLREYVMNAYEGAKEAFGAFENAVDEVLGKYKPDTKYPKSSRYPAYINVNQVVKRHRNRNIRSMAMVYTRVRQRR